MKNHISPFCNRLIVRTYLASAVILITIFVVVSVRSASSVVEPLHSISDPANLVNRNISVASPLLASITVNTTDDVVDGNDGRCSFREALFAANVTYRYHPYDDPIEGRDAVVASWLGDDGSPDASGRDQSGTYDASYRAVAVDAAVAVATGSTRYREEPGGPITRTFDNCFVIRFDDDGRCVDFVEWFIERPTSSR